MLLETSMLVMVTLTPVLVAVLTLRCAILIVVDHV